MDYVIVQSIHYCFLPIYARGFHRNFYYLKPQAKPVQALIISHLVQWILLWTQNHLMDYQIYYRLVRGARLRFIPRRVRRFLRRCLLNRVKKDHEWGWRTADHVYKQ